MTRVLFNFYTPENNFFLILKVPIPSSRNLVRTGKEDSLPEKIRVPGHIDVSSVQVFRP